MSSNIAQSLGSRCLGKGLQSRATRVVGPGVVWLQQACDLSGRTHCYMQYLCGAMFFHQVRGCCQLGLLFLVFGGVLKLACCCSLEGAVHLSIRRVSSLLQSGTAVAGLLVLAFVFQHGLLLQP